AEHAPVAGEDGGLRLPHPERRPQRVGEHDDSGPLRPGERVMHRAGAHGGDESTSRLRFGAMAETMRAAVYERYGPARDVLRVAEIDRPEPGPGEVRVRVRVSAVNPTDGRVGTRVWVWFAAHGRQHGSAAQWVCLPERQAVPLPAGASFELGASLGI